MYTYAYICTYMYIYVHIYIYLHIGLYSLILQVKVEWQGKPQLPREKLTQGTALKEYLAAAKYFLNMYLPGVLTILKGSHVCVAASMRRRPHN